MFDPPPFLPRRFGWKDLFWERNLALFTLASSEFNMLGKSTRTRTWSLDPPRGTLRKDLPATCVLFFLNSKSPTPFEISDSGSPFSILSKILNISPPNFTSLFLEFSSYVNSLCIYIKI